MNGNRLHFPVMSRQKAEKDRPSRKCGIRAVLRAMRLGTLRAAPKARQSSFSDSNTFTAFSIADSILLLFSASVEA